MLTQAEDFGCVVPEKLVRPPLVCSFATVFRQCQADSFERTEIVLQVFWLREGAEDEDPVGQSGGNFRLNALQPGFFVVEINQENHQAF